MVLQKKRIIKHAKTSIKESGFFWLSVATLLGVLSATIFQSLLLSLTRSVRFPRTVSHRFYSFPILNYPRQALQYIPSSYTFIYAYVATQHLSLRIVHTRVNGYSAYTPRPAVSHDFTLAHYDNITAPRTGVSVSLCNGIILGIPPGANYIAYSLVNYIARYCEFTCAHCKKITCNL